MKASSGAFTASIAKYRNILIIIKGSPDPDAIASSFAISAVCRSLNVSSTIVATKKLSLPQNRAMVGILDIPLDISPRLPDPGQFDAYIVTDHPSSTAGELTESLPCAVYIDHHEPSVEKAKADFILREEDAGSTSTLVALLIKNLDAPLESSTMTSIATALLYGIYTDTDKYSRAGKLDYEALDFLSHFSDHEAFNRISSIPLSRETLGLIKTAIANKIVHKDWLIAGVGFIDASHRDSIAIIADFLLRREEYPTVIVFAAVEDQDMGRLAIDASFRSSSESLDLDPIIKQISPEGGARRFKGAYQIQIDYFRHCPDRALLWEVIRLATVEMLEKSREEMYLTELKGFYQRFRKKIRDYFQ